MWHVYIIKCSDNSLYTGITNNLSSRIKKHNQRRGGTYTKSRAPVTIVHKEPHRTKSGALKREAQIKSFSRAGKLALINQ
jgi:putative endonuclease